MNKLQHKEAVVRVARRLLETKVDEVVSLQQLSDAAECDLGQYRWVVTSAMRVVNGEFGAVFATVRREGYRRLDRATGALFAGNRGLHRIRRASRSAMRIAGNAARFANEMTAEQRREHNQKMAALGLVNHLTLAKTVQSMPETPAERPDPLAGLREAIGA